MKKSKINILALDPSLTAFGYVVMQKSKVKDFGCVKTSQSDKKLKFRKADDRLRRVKLIADVLLNLINTYDVKFIVSELPHGSQNAVAATSLGLVSGMIQGIAVGCDIPLEWFSEADSKQTSIGKSAVSKAEMILAMESKFTKGVKWVTGIKYRDEAVADSLSVYNCALQTSPVIGFLNKK